MADQRQRQVKEVDVSNLLVDAGIRAVKANPKISTGYVVGILICMLGTGLVPSQESEEAMDRQMLRAEQEYGKSLMKAEKTMRNAEAYYHNSKGWFSCNPECQRHKNAFDAASDEYWVLKRAYDSEMAEARSNVGIFSTYGVAEVRRSFWRSFAGGKEFAKRQTMWDALFIGIRTMGRDESLIEYGLRVMMNMIFNFTLGLFGALIGFIFSLWGLITSFGASLTTGAAFFALAVLAGTAFVASWLVGLYAAAAGTVYFVGKAAINNARLADAQRRAHPNLRYQQGRRHHYD